MPLIMDIMNQNAWGSVELIEEVLSEVEYKPGLLRSLDLFEPIYSRSRAIAIAAKEGQLSLIPTSEQGEAPKELIPKGAKLRYFQTLRLAEGSTVYASELAGLLALPVEDQTAEVVSEIQDRYQQIVDDMELTWEHLIFGAIQGRLVDADGSTVLYNWFDEFEVSEPGEINFALGTATTNVRAKCRDVGRKMKVASKGVWMPGTRVIALAGDKFFDDLVAHPSIKETRLNTERAKSLEDIEGYSTFDLENITFINFRGMDPDSKEAGKLDIATDACRFFPKGARGAFKMGYGPADEFKEGIGKKGEPLFPIIMEDKDRGAWDRVEAYSYPLPVCTRPKMLMKARGR